MVLKKRNLIALGLISTMISDISFAASNEEQLDETKINNIIQGFLVDLNNVPSNACITLPGFGHKLPAYVKTSVLQTAGGEMRKDIDSLIKNKLMTVKINAKKGSLYPEDPDYIKGEEFPLSYIELTPEGEKFLRHDKSKPIISKSGNKIVFLTNSFCAYVLYGGMEKFTKPTKNPFDNNPHKVSWVNFLWKPDLSKTPWLADEVLMDALPYYPEDYPKHNSKKENWARIGMMLEQSDDGVWGAGEKPYTLRW
ncbi:hypothetical protein RHD99_06535 [Buttiauxella selenatireducens]|uniref:Uncharacterized protein n=1 Tax=Buttiauxella selenatireducens TaxID=3073902 RepID=A0ABY9SDM8_9ENTR|nr:hypothetical protein [Buttiauxella sp. R73]WMY75599.1 hypothetical protein RHD99_06535 [Buttiauxella sp. R73]